jgi:DNA-binding response OmpR family regulator
MSEDTPKILVADDDKDILKMVEFTFADENFRLSFAEDGEEALRKVEQERPDLVLLDVKMPKLDGIEVCQRIKQEEGSSHITVILITHLSLEKDLIKGFEGGADDYIIKPFSVGNLKARVKSWLMRKGTTVT